MNYYLGPWVLDAHDSGELFWRAPTGTVGLVDLRPLRNVEVTGFFATPETLDSDYELIGTQLDGNMTSAQKAAWISLLSLDSLDAATPLDALWEVLTYRADPDGDLRTLPIMPTHLGVLELHLGGHSLVKLEIFTGTNHSAWPNLQKLLQKQYKEIRKQAKKDGTDVHQRMLTTWMRKFKVKDHKLFIPSDLPDEQPKTPHTTITDDFNRDNADALGASAEGWSWTEVVGDIDIDTNTARIQAAAWVTHCARAESDLSSSDHYAQAEVVALVGGGNEGAFGVDARFAAGATTYYSASLQWRYTPAYRCRLDKVVTGTITNLGSTNVELSLPDTVKIEVDGSTIKSYFNGVEQSSVTNTSIAGGTRTGISGYRHYSGTDNAQGDNFEAADLAAPPAGAVMRMMKETELGANLFGGLIHVG